MSPARRDPPGVRLDPMDTGREKLGSQSKNSLGKGCSARSQPVIHPGEAGEGVPFLARCLQHPWPLGGASLRGAHKPARPQQMPHPDGLGVLPGLGRLRRQHCLSCGSGYCCGTVARELPQAMGTATKEKKNDLTEGETSGTFGFHAGNGSQRTGKNQHRAKQSDPTTQPFHP